MVMAEDKETAEVADTDALTSEEQSYFESGGEQEVKETGNAEQAETETQAESETETGVLNPDKEGGEKEQERAKDEKGRYVPHQALHAEREEHKKTRSELQDLKEFRARMEERWRLMEQNQQKEKEPEETPPDPNEDIFGAYQYQAKQLEKLNAKLTEREQQEQQSQQQSQQDQAIWSYWNTDAQRYTQENEDFPNAAKWLAETRDKQLQALSVADQRFADPRARGAQIDTELKQIVAAAAQRGQSAAEYVYQIATSYGYTKQEAKEAAENAGNEVSEKLERIEKAQEASKTVGQASGRSGGDEITPEAVAAMSEDEFNRWVGVPENARRFEKWMGG